MSWAPIHAGHAIERVRLLVAFSESLPSKVLSKCADSLTRSHADFGFTEISQVGSSSIAFHIGPKGIPEPVANPQNGWALKRQVDGVIVEELGLRDSGFAYVASQYVSWAEIRGRLEQVLLPALMIALDVADASAVKLEYWDTFAFDGALDDARASDLLAMRPPCIPDAAYDGPENWHSHIGWFERVRGSRLLINQNFDAIDLKREGDDVENKAVNIYTLTEQRFENWKLEMDNFWETVDNLHAKSLQLFTASISAEQRDAIGIDEDGKANV